MWQLTVDSCYYTPIDHAPRPLGKEDTPTWLVSKESMVQRPPGPSEPVWVTTMLKPSVLKEWRHISTLQAERRPLGSPSSKAAGLVWVRNPTFRSAWRCFHLLFWNGRAGFDLLCDLSVHFGRVSLMLWQRVVGVPSVLRAACSKTHILTEAADRASLFEQVAAKTSETYNYADSASPLLASEIAEIPASISEYAVELVWTIRASKTVQGWWWWRRWDVKNVNTWMQKK